MSQGDVAASEWSARATGEIQRGTTRSVDGAVEAFVSDAAWVLASPAAEQYPRMAARTVSASLTPMHQQLLAQFSRAGGVEYTPENGAYRALGWSGQEARPDKVMVEVVAPLTVGDKARWVVIGGVIAWVESHWELESISPREIDQPSVGDGPLSAMSRRDQRTLTEGLGWFTFAPARE